LVFNCCLYASVVAVPDIDTGATPMSFLTSGKVTDAIPKSLDGIVSVFRKRNSFRLLNQEL